ncbi:hypothetical protein [Amphibacillus jilinensis]|uniref:hypothetical protein n=1 Tax=Amphibacillus jilinensis TaxID=1216008 RepID=UPI000474E224|nr:hypothetical protein [Amphibacillus jilinensis]
MRAKFVGQKNQLSKEEKAVLREFDDREQPKKAKHTSSMEPLAFHLAIVGASIMIGYVLSQLLILFESVTWGGVDRDAFISICTAFSARYDRRYVDSNLILALVAISWNVFAFLVIAPKMIPQLWFERGIGDLGQAMGMTATGLLLMKIADPENQSPALEDFGYSNYCLNRW